MKLNKISTLWEFLPVCTKDYDVQDTFGYFLFLILLIAGITVIVYNNLFWLHNNFSIFTIKLIKQSFIYWLIITPPTFYISVNEIYNQYVKELNKDED